MSFLEVVKVLSGLLPLVQAAVHMAEMIFGPGRGTEKAKHAADTVMAALPKAEEFAGELDVAAQAVKPLINSVVAAANAAGLFEKSADIATASDAGSRAPAPAPTAARSDASSSKAARAPAELVGEHDVVPSSPDFG